MALNRVCISGNLGRDVELKYTQGGTAVATLAIGVDNRRKKGDEWIDDTVWVEATAWGKTAEFVAEYFSKGSSIILDGRLQLDQWETDGGERRSRLKVVAENISFAGKKGEGGGGKPQGGGQRKSKPKPQPAPQSAPSDDDIPF